MDVPKLPVKSLGIIRNLVTRVLAQYMGDLVPQRSGLVVLMQSLDGTNSINRFFIKFLTTAKKVCLGPRKEQQGIFFLHP
ncbi:MAG: hypothetical protein DWQ00_12925 [Candidatus Scalindua sp.]|nr:MAG: hypothetical protein DWQ00_12925 [Candidatus Scalindua sp.]